jgi:putative DNA primase/helicase
VTADIRTAGPPGTLPTPRRAKDELSELQPDAYAARQRARELAALVGAHVTDKVAIGEWRDLLKGYGGLPLGDFGSIVKQAAEQRKADQEAREANARAAEHAERVTAAAWAGSLLPSPAAPLSVARALQEREPHTDGCPHRAWWRDDFYRWDGVRWITEPTSAVRKWVFLATEHAQYDAGEVRGVAAWQPDRDKVNKVVDALGTAVVQRAADLGTDQAIACTNGVYDLATGVLLPHSPRRFNVISLPYAYDPAATCPLWLRFLDQVLPDIEGVPAEEQAQQFLREWFGYCLSCRTDLQKMAALTGPPRCGKGTVARVLKALLGEDNVVAPTLRSMGGPFGEEAFIGKTLAILGDVRWHSQAAAEAIDIFLAITGEDPHDVQRKNRTAWHGTLGLRFMTMSNDPPVFNDASGALAIRMIQLLFSESFLGREDTGLTGRLLSELPGIFNWAIEGLRELNARGHFVQPACGAETNEQVRRLASPEYAFIDDTCTLDEKAMVALDELHTEYRKWCAREDKKHVSSKESFGAKVVSSFHGKVRIIRPGKRGDVRPRYVQGLRLGQSEPTEDAPVAEAVAGHGQDTAPPQPDLFDPDGTCPVCSFGFDTVGHEANCERGAR